MTHLDILQLRLSNERQRLADATNEGEKALRKVWVAQLEREVSDESINYFYNMRISDDELLAELAK